MHLRSPPERRWHQLRSQSPSEQNRNKTTAARPPPLSPRLQAVGVPRKPSSSHWVSAARVPESWDKWENHALTFTTGAPLASTPISISFRAEPATLTYLQLHGAAAAAAKQAGVKQVSVSISHSDSQAVALRLNPREYLDPGIYMRIQTENARRSKTARPQQQHLSHDSSDNANISPASWCCRRRRQAGGCQAGQR
jgi:hypothetical protein